MIAAALVALMVTSVPVQPDQKPGVAFIVGETAVGEGTLLDVRIIDQGEEAPEDGCFLDAATCIQKAQDQSICNADREGCKQRVAELEKAISEIPDQGRVPPGKMWLASGIGAAVGIILGFVVAGALDRD